MKLDALFLFGLVGFIVAGCGGGGASAVVVPPQEFSGGSVRVQGALNPATVDTVAGGLSVYGFSGAITKAYWSDASPTLAETELVFPVSTLRDGDQIVACEPDGYGMRVLVNLADPPSQIRVSNDGAWIYFVESSTLKRVPVAGGPVTSILADVRSFALTPSGTRFVAYRPSADTVVVANVNGTGVEVRLTPPETTVPFVVGCVSENQGLILDAYESGNPGLYSFNLTGAINRVGWIGFTNSTVYHVEMHPMRDRVLALFKSFNDQKTYLVEYFLKELGVWPNIVWSTFEYAGGVQSFAYSPDSQQLLAARFANERLSLELTDRALNVLTGPVATGDLSSYGFAWAPSPTFRTLVGAGNYTSGAAALLLTEKDRRTLSVVLADCTTRTTMQVQRVSDDNDGSLIYQMTCDNLTKLHYTKSNGFVQSSVVGSLTGLKGAFVTFDVGSGRVSNIVKPSPGSPN